MRNTDKFAQNNPGVVLRGGIGVKRNHAEVIDWFKRTAVYGYSKRRLKLAQLYERIAGERK